MKNNSGFTVVELIVSFSLALVIAVFLFQIIISLKNLYTNSILKTELINIQSLISRKMNESFNKTVIEVNECGQFCAEFVYADNSTEKLNIENGYIEFGNYKTKLPDKSYVKNLEVNIASAGTISKNTNNSILIVDLQLYNDNFAEENFGVKILFQFDSTINNLELNDNT